MAAPAHLLRNATVLILPALGLAAWLHAQTLGDWVRLLLPETPAPRPAPATSPARPATKPKHTPSQQIPERAVEPKPERAALAARGWPDCAGDTLVVAIAASDPEASLAVVRTEPSNGAGTSRLGRVGDRVGSRKIEHIASDRVYFSGDSGPCQARLGEQPVQLAAFHPRVSPTPTRGTIRPVGDGQFEVDRRDLETLIANPSLLGPVRVTRAQLDGKVVGVRITGVRSGLLSDLGLRDGDILESVNGYSLADPETTMLAYARLRTTDRLALRVIRGRGVEEFEVDVR